MLIQPRLVGKTRHSRHAALIEEIEAKLESIAVKENVSKSYIIATILADALGITNKVQMRYYDDNRQVKSKSQNVRRLREAG